MTSHAYSADLSFLSFKLGRLFYSKFLSGRPHRRTEELVCLTDTFPPPPQKERSLRSHELCIKIVFRILFTFL